MAPSAVVPPTTFAVRAAARTAGLRNVACGGIDHLAVDGDIRQGKRQNGLSFELARLLVFHQLHESVSPAGNDRLAVDQNRLIHARAESLPQPGDIGIDAFDHSNGDGSSRRNLDAGHRRWRRRRLLGEALIAATIAVAVSISVRWRRGRWRDVSTELQIAHVSYIVRIHVIADGQADMAGVTTQILAVITLPLRRVSVSAEHRPTITMPTVVRRSHIEPPEPI